MNTQEISANKINHAKSPESSQIPEINRVMQDADHIDVKVYTGTVLLSEFIAGFLSYYPAWMKALYGMRWGFVRVLGMKQEGMPNPVQLHPNEITWESGQKASIFTVAAAEREHYWLVFASGPHLTAYLAVIASPLNNGQHEFQVVTIVHYHNWTGPVYFNVIRPFHHIVVNSMSQAGLRYRLA